MLSSLRNTMRNTMRNTKFSTEVLECTQLYIVSKCRWMLTLLSEQTRRPRAAAAAYIIILHVHVPSGTGLFGQAMRLTLSPGGQEPVGQIRPPNMFWTSPGPPGDNPAQHKSIFEL